MPFLVLGLAGRSGELSWDSCKFACILTSVGKPEAKLAILGASLGAV